MSTAVKKTPRGRLCITGAAGTAATLIRPLLRHRYDLTLFTQEPLDPHEGEKNVVGDLTDFDDVNRAVAGTDAVVHLGGISSEGSFDPMIGANITGTHHVLTAAARRGVQRVLVASSFHAAGGLPITEAGTAAPWHAQPTSFYGASKVAVEAVAAAHAHAHQLAVVAARIGTILPEPRTRRHLATWLSPADFVRLIDALVDLQRPGYFPLWAISANSRRWVSLAPGRALGFVPVDDSEQFSEAVLANVDDPSGQWGTLGGPWHGLLIKDER